MSAIDPYQLAFCFVPQVGAVTAKTLVSYCGSAEAVFQASRRELLRIPGIGTVTADAIKQAHALEKAEQEAMLMEKYGIEAIFYTDERYPARLRQNVDCPALLFYKGSDPAQLNALRIIGIVGTRQPSEYGKAICEEIVAHLSEFGIVVVSGLAYGIDITTHRKATQLQMPNIGVLGHGLGKIYPAAHHATALKMIENGGLLSEYAFHKGPDREHFPMRNRIIAGMCDGLLVVETGETGGSMITAELANQYEREIFAVPGRVRDPKSAGCNLLIKTHRARLVESAAEIAETLRWDEKNARRSVQTQLFQELSEQENKLLELIRGQSEIAIDLLSHLSGIRPGELASLLLELEFKGLIRALPGKRYLLNG